MSTTAASVDWLETSVVIAVSDAAPWATWDGAVSDGAVSTAASADGCVSTGATEELATSGPAWDAAPASPCTTAAVEPACSANVTTVCSVVIGLAAAAAPTTGAAICMLAFGKSWAPQRHWQLPHLPAASMIPMPLPEPVAMGDGAASAATTAAECCAFETTVAAAARPSYENIRICE